LKSRGNSLSSKLGEVGQQRRSKIIIMPGMPSEAELQRAKPGPGLMKTARFAYDARAPDELR